MMFIFMFATLHTGPQFYFIFCTFFFISIAEVKGLNTLQALILQLLKLCLTQMIYHVFSC